MISWFYKQIACQLSVLSILAMCFSPANGTLIAQDAYYYGENTDYNTAEYYGNTADYYGNTAGYDNCCYDPCEEECCDNNYWKWGALALAAAAGAGVAYAVSHGKKGHSGDDGSDGAGGISGGAGTGGAAGATGAVFPPDGDELLVFDISLIVTAAVEAIDYTAFVTLPDGTTIEGTTISSAAPGTINFPSILVSPALVGTYTVGVQGIPAAPPATFTAFLSANVIASRDGSTTALTSVPQAVVGVSETQFTEQFVYDLANVP